jgi:hypothetical protein
METTPLSELGANLPDGLARSSKLIIWLLLGVLIAAGVVAYLVLSGAAASAAGDCGGG